MAETKPDIFGSEAVPATSHTYLSPPYVSSQQPSRKRKCLDDSDDLPPSGFVENDHITKKQRDEVVAPLTPTSPPISFPGLQRPSPPSSQESIQYFYTLPNDNTPSLPPPSYVTYPPPKEIECIPSDNEPLISSQNIFLRDLHMNSRTYQYNHTWRGSETHKDDEMWEEEEETVAERYSVMNKILGSRRGIFWCYMITDYSGICMSVYIWELILGVLHSVCWIRLGCVIVLVY